MQAPATAAPRWTTSSIGQAADASALELASLGHHLALCRGSTSHLFALQCAAHTMTGFATARFVSTVLVFVALLGALLLAR